MGKLKITLQGFEIEAEGAAAVNALQAMAGWLRASAPAALPEEAEEEEADYPEEEEGEEEAEAETSEEEDAETGSNTDAAMQVLRSEARQAGVGSGWFTPSGISGMAARAGLGVDQFRSAFAYLKKVGRIEVDSESSARPKPIRIPEAE